MLLMRAAIYDTYGLPEVLRVEDVETPQPGDKDVLVRVGAAPVSAADATFRAGTPRYSRLFTGLTKPKAKTLGVDFAGEVVAVGKDVSRFAVGDRVLGATGATFGAHAEYVRVPADGPLVMAPANLSYDEAASLSGGVLTALPFLRDHAHLRQGQEILINGASGQVGLAAVQLAKHFGARVVGVCSTAKLDLVTSYGADEVVDYVTEDFTRASRSYDVVFDAAGKSSFARCERVLKSGGAYLTAVPSPAIFRQSLWTRWFGDKRAGVAFTGLRKDGDKTADLRFLVEIAEAGHIRPAIDERYPLARAAEAHRRIESGLSRGTVLITMERHDS
jgi:NADPH:quinone reductase-like Zn-dependent oxidoreductase